MKFEMMCQRSSFCFIRNDKCTAGESKKCNRYLRVNRILKLSADKILRHFEKEGCILYGENWYGQMISRLSKFGIPEKEFKQAEDFACELFKKRR